MADDGRSIVQWLLENGVISADQAEQVYECHRRTGSPFGEIVLELGLAKQRHVWTAIAHLLGVAFADVDRIEISKDAVALLDAEFAAAHNVIPLKLDGMTLFFATSYINTKTFDKVRERTGRRVVPVLADPTAIRHAIARFY